ncbi:hypothetical protein [Candidatus Binatus sp.]|uniref:hypothetical protein n=1 Tax=Candidatus Binatus sp. TaxID=2811406 RepID=UPI003C528671
MIHHRHSGGNYPHVHHYDAADKSHDHDHEHPNEYHHSHGHGDHVYDVHGNEAAIVASDPHRLEHWHFDRPFERRATAPIRDVVNEFPVAVVTFANHDLNRLPQAARPPPVFF